MDYIPQFGGAVGQQDVSGLPADDTMMQLELKRRLDLAKSLQNQEMPQGQMVSGRYVAPSWTQYLANAADKYYGLKEEEKAMKQFGEYQTAKAKKYADLLGETDQTKFQQGLAQMPEFAPELVKARLTSKANQPVVVGKTLVKPDTGEVVYQEPQTEKTGFGNINPSDFTPASLAKFAQTKNYADLQIAPKQLTPYEAQSLALRRQEIGNQKAPAGYTWNQQGGLVAIPGGPADKAINPTEAQSNANLFGTRAEKANQSLNTLEGKYSPAKVQLQNFTGSVPGASYLANKFMSDADQKASQAQMDFVTAILRKESGASISQSEFDNARRQYFPQPGDSPAVIKQKAANRQTAIEGIKASAGPMNKPSGKVVVDY